MRKLLLTIAVASILASPASASAAPPGFFGMAPQNALNATDFRLMARAGIESVRLPLNWSIVQEESPVFGNPDWTAFDRDVELAAERGIEIFPFLSSTPPWAARYPTAEPVETVWQRWAWSKFLREAARRYGPEGSFWRERPEIPYLPFRRWEIWNEQNIVTFSHRPSPERFARLIRISGRVLHRADPGAEVILGGLFGRPLQVPPNVHSGDFLARVYRAGGVKPFFDAVALHPYVSDAGAMRSQIENLRRIMRNNGDRTAPVYVTEIGWGSDSGESRWERGLYGQARQLDRAFGMLSANRRRWRIGGAWWFSWTDAGGFCQFCDSAGLLTADHEAKPAWYRFNAWSGGDAGAVPRATFAP